MMLLRDLTIVGGNGGLEHAMIESTGPGGMFLERVTVDGAHAGSTGILWARGGEVRAIDSVITNFRGDDHGAFRADGERVWLTRTLVTGGVSGTVVGAHLGPGGSLTLSESLFDGNEGRSVIRQEEGSTFSCSGGVGIDSGAVRNRASAFEFEWPWLGREFRSYEWYLEGCDFGEGGDTNDFDIVWDDNRAEPYLGNDRTEQVP